MKYYKVLTLCLGSILSVYPLFAQQPELIVQSGHTGRVYSVAFSPDGLYVLTGSDDKTAKLWDVRTGFEVRTFEGHAQGISSVTFIPDGGYVLTGSWDNTAKLWDAVTGLELLTFKGHSDGISSVAVSPDGHYLLTGSADTTAKLWNAATGVEVRTFKGHSAGISSVAYSPDGRYVLSGSADGTARLWDAATGLQVHTFRGHSAGISSVAFSPDGHRVLTGCADGTATLWDINSGKWIDRFRGHSDGISSVAFSPNGRYVLTGSADGTARLWWEIPIEEYTFRGHLSVITSVAFSTDGRYVLTGSWDQTARMWDAASGMEVCSFKGYTPSDITCAAFCSDGRYLLTGSNDGTARMWDAATGMMIRDLKGHSKRIECVAFSPNCRYALTGSLDGSAKLWDAATGVEVRTFYKRKWPRIMSVAFSPDDRFLLIVHNRLPVLWDVETGMEIRIFGHSGLVNSVAFSPDGLYVLTGSRDKTAKIWSANTGKLIRTYQGHSSQVTSVAFSPDGHNVLTGSADGTARLWDAITGMEVYTFKGDSLRVHSVAFSPDGHYVLIGSGGFFVSKDCTAKLRDVATGMEVRTFQGYSGMEPSAVFSSDGRYVLTGKADRTAKLWETATGLEVITLIPIDESDFITRTTDSYYTCSMGALHSVAFKVDNKVFPFEQFDLKFNRPDIVMERLGKTDSDLTETYHKAWLRRLRKMGFSEEDLFTEMRLPEVKLDRKNLLSSSYRYKVDLNITAWDDKYLLDRINVFINDVPIFGVRGIDLRDQKTRKVEKTISIDLSAGLNKIQISVHNEKGVESLKETAHITLTGTMSKPVLYLVAIGASEYQDTRYNLGFAAKDASDIISVFKAVTGSRYRSIKALLLSNEKVTRENIIAAKAFFNQSSEDDVALLFIAGHGLVDSEYNYYFGTYDVDFSNPAQRGLPYEEIDNLLDGIPARKKLLLLDACFSGEIDKTEMQLVAANVNPEVSGAVKMRAFIDKRGIRIKKGLVENALMLQQDLFADLRRGTGAVVISSSSGDEYSFEGLDWKNGVFTYALLEGLRSKQADENKDGQIQVSELQKYVMERVKALTNGGQNPTVRQENLADDFVIY